MSTGFGVAILQARLQTTLDHLVIGGAPKVRIYDGAQPAFGGTATNLLAEFTLSSPAGTIVGSNLYSDLTLPADATVLMNGTATWARVINGAGTVEFDTDVAVSGKPITLGTLALIAGAELAMTSARVS